MLEEENYKFKKIKCFEDLKSALSFLDNTTNRAALFSSPFNFKIRVKTSRDKIYVSLVKNQLFSINEYPIVVCGFNELTKEVVFSRKIPSEWIYIYLFFVCSFVGFAFFNKINFQENFASLSIFLLVPILFVLVKGNSVEKKLKDEIDRALKNTQ